MSELLSKSRREELARLLADRYGCAPEVFASSPGRTELIGNHTDHQGGRVLAAAVTLSLGAAAARTPGGRVRVFSDGVGEVDITLDSLEPRASERGTSSALVRGIAAAMAASGADLSGLDIAVCGSVPVGSGLSSSACFELLMVSVMHELWSGGELSPLEAAKIAQRAENEYFGKPCGLMDQLACAYGGVIAADFANAASPRAERLELDPEKLGYALCLVDCGAGHEDLTREYAAVSAEMRSVARFFGAEALRGVPEETFRRGLRAARERCGDRAVLRAMHFYAEDARAVKAAQAVRRGCMDELVSLMRESGRSSAMYLQNLVPAGETRSQPLLLAQAVCASALGGEGAVRVHGGGFAGTLLAAVPLSKVSGLTGAVESVLGRGACRELHIRPYGAAAERA